MIKTNNNMWKRSLKSKRPFPQNAKKELIKMFNPENVVYNTETKKYELVNVELPDDYFIQDENGEWVELYPITKPSDEDHETIAAEMQEAFPFEHPTDDELEKMAREFKFELKHGENLIGMEY